MWVDKMNDANEKAAITYQDMLLKHGKIKQCKPVDQEGCGEFKKISEFRYTYRDKGYGKRKYWDSWCSECSQKRRQARYDYEKTHGKSGVKKPVYHTGPKPGSIDHKFFCR